MTLDQLHTDNRLAPTVQALNGQWEGIMAYADADFILKSATPIFINIWSKKPGLGNLIFRYFLEQVGVENLFLSTDFTDAGAKLFAKLQAEKVIERQQHDTAPWSPYKTAWKVISDPWAEPKRIIAGLPEEEITRLLAVRL